MIKISKFDAAEHLKTSEDIAGYLAAAFETGDQDAVNTAIGTVAKARGMAQIAEKTGIGREQLYKAFKKGSNPTMKTLFSVLSAFDVTLTASAAQKVPTAKKKAAVKRKPAAKKKAAVKRKTAPRRAVSAA